MKVYELATELKISSLELVDELKSYGINVKNHMDTITKEQADLFKKKREVGLTLKDEEELKRKEQTLINIKDIKAKQEIEDKKKEQEILENFPKECEKFVFMMKRFFDQGHPLSESSNAMYEVWAKFERKNRPALKRKKKSND